MIDETIKSLIYQNTNQTFDVIIVGMDEHNLIKSYSEQVTFLETEKPTPPAIARNMGVSLSSGDILFFIDADCTAPPDWIESHLNVHHRYEQPVVVGGSVAFPNNHYLTLSDNVSTFHEFMTHIPPMEKDYLPSLNISIPRSVWDLSGGFNPDFPFPSGEDTDLTLRIKMNKVPILFEPEAKVTHLPNRQTVTSLLKHAYRFGYCSVKSNPFYWQILHVPYPLKHWTLSILLSPILAAYIIFKIVFIEHLPLRYWHTLPVIYFLKIAWCFGYAAQLRSLKE